MEKKIPCRNCKKMFVPCAYCQSNNETFRWRNFACSIECAKKYIAEATEYRNKKDKKIDIDLKNDVEKQKETVDENIIVEITDKTDYVKEETEIKQPYRKKKESRKTDTE